MRGCGVSQWRGYIDDIRVDEVDGGYAAGHPDYPGVEVRDCPWLAAWHVVRSVRVMRKFGLEQEEQE